MVYFCRRGNKMLRFYYVIFVSIIPIIYYLIKCSSIMHHPDRYDEDSRYKTALYACRTIRNRARIHTDVFGTENLPVSGGYIMYPNHQGKYDAVGIILTHQKPCTILVDEKRSHLLLLNEMIQILNGKRLDKTDPRSQVRTMLEISEEVKVGRKYIVFPEGGYDEVKDNSVQSFLPGAFKAAVKAECPIVPVAIIDSYKAFGVNSLKRVKTQVHYLEPICYEDYRELNTKEISELVRNVIVKKIDEVISV